MGQWRPEVNDGRTMSDTHGTTDAAEAPHGSDPAHGDESHGDGHDPHGGHGHLGEPLGPIGWAMWGAGVVGVLVALAMTAALAYSTGFSFTA